uniref:Uncharacterized protein n=1 Tax=Anopheles christyi TaxID=43041 RepID=A0A182K2G2_9DIPT
MPPLYRQSLNNNNFNVLLTGGTDTPYRPRPNHLDFLLSQRVCPFHIGKHSFLSFSFFVINYFLLPFPKKKKNN